MTGAEARRVLLVQAFESPPAAPWTEADAAACSAEALRREGSEAGAERLIVRRAALAAERLAERLPAVRARLAPGSGRGLGVVLVLAAFAAGIGLDALGPAGRINLLAPPLLALLAWNLGVYALMLLRALQPSATRAQRWLAGVPARLQAAGAARRRQTPPLARDAADWAAAAAPLHAARAAALLHAAAAALAAGAIGAMFLRGLAFEYRAGWESTFLDASAVHALLSVVLAPALALSGGLLPDPAALEALRFPQSAGENAARWIGWHALTVALVVILPRVLLAGAAALRARRLAARFPLALTGDYFERLARSLAGGELRVRVLPYSFHPPAGAQAALERTLEAIVGGRTRVHLAGVVPEAGEDELAPRLAALPGGDRDAALFALGATPERETHGAFVAALAASGGPPPLVLVDESGLRARWSGADGAARLEARREAWRRMLGAVGLAPHFVELA